MVKNSKVLALFLAISFAVVLSGVAQQQADETVTCPVSGKEIKKSEAKATFEYKGETYYFYCEKCKEAFVKDPEKYTQKKAEMKLEKKMMAKKHMHGEEKMHSKMMQMKMHKKGEEKACCPMMGLMGSKDIEVNVENLEDGVAVKITSKNADVVKKIQEGVAKMKEMCKQKAANCKEEVKKEEIKK